MTARRPRRTGPVGPEDALVQSLDEALARISDLAGRLWQVRDVHHPGRSLLGRLRCRGCGEAYPCATARAAGTAAGATATVPAAGTPALRRTA